MAIDSLHLTVPDSQIHPPKGFATASRGQYMIKNEQNGISWVDVTSLPNVISSVDATAVPPTENDQDAYLLLGTPDGAWDGALDGYVVKYDANFDTWFSFPPATGQRAYDVSRNGYWTYNGTDWNGIFNASILIPSVEILALNTTPKTVIASPGIGKVAVIIEADTSMDGSGTPYATFTDLLLITDTATFHQRGNSVVLQTAILHHAFLSGPLTDSTETILIENKAVLAKVDDGDPTTGDGDLQLFIMYKIITV